MHILMVKRVQRTAVDCANRTFIGIQTIGYHLNDEAGGIKPGAPPIGGRTKLIPLKNDPLTNRITQLVCSQPAVPGGTPLHPAPRLRKPSPSS